MSATMGDLLLTVLYLSMICALISTTISESYVFKWLRKLVTDINFHAGVGISCAYCLSHWVSAFIVLTHFGWLGLTNTIGYTFAVAWASVIQWAILKALLKYAKVILSDERQ